MRKAYLLFLFWVCWVTTSAQTNTFPSTGNVGIGTLLPGNKLTVLGNLHASGTIGGRSGFYNVLSIGPLGSSPAYFYFDTNIPAIDAAAPQLQITGYTYGVTNKALKVTLGWYHFSGNFYWTQYHSDLGYEKPSRIRLGKYTKNGAQFIRVEISNNSGYWSSYTVSATDPFGYVNTYDDWIWYEGEMPTSTTSSIVQVNRWEDIIIDGKLGVGTNNPSHKLSVNGEMRWGGSNDYAISGQDGGGLYFEQIGSSLEKGKIRIQASRQSDFTNYAQLIIDPTNGFSFRTTGNANGNVGIGTPTPTEKLSVNGNIKAKKIIVSQSGWPDYVFHPNYPLKPLSEVEKFILKHKHLPEMPSASEVNKQGISVGDNQALLLKKVEELTLYLIRLDKENEQMKKQINEQSVEIKQLKRKK